MFFARDLQTCFMALFSCLCVTAATVDGGCPQECSCPVSLPTCSPGTSFTMDDCGCCKVCARQFNEDCGPSQPCDHIKGLQCQMGAGGDPKRGLCRAEAQGRPCEFNGRLYQHGEDFQPSCQHQCSCMDGVVGCMPLCPHRVPPPDPRCASPRLTRPEGRCCEEWVCEDTNHVGEGSEQPPLHPNAISNALPPAALRRPNAVAMFQEWMTHPKTSIPPRAECFPQTTEWSECSSTCGMGVSSRVTNSNAECRLVRETRLCQIRQCDLALRPVLKGDRKCQRTVRPRKAERITFAGCSTVRRYRVLSCGSCADGRCCSPSQSHTVRMLFVCPDGESFMRHVMWIRRCVCGHRCPAQDTPSGPSVSLHNDVHTFAE